MKLEPIQVDGQLIQTAFFTNWSTCLLSFVVLNPSTIPLVNLALAEMGFAGHSLPNEKTAFRWFLGSDKDVLHIHQGRQSRSRVGTDR